MLSSSCREQAGVREEILLLLQTLLLLLLLLLLQIQTGSRDKRGQWCL